MILIAPVKAAAQDMWVTTSAINLRNDIRNNVWDRQKYRVYYHRGSKHQHVEVFKSRSFDSKGKAGAAAQKNNGGLH